MQAAITTVKAQAIPTLTATWTRLRSSGWSDIVCQPIDFRRPERIDGNLGVNVFALGTFKSSPLGMVGAKGDAGQIH
jgi:hypothetical protein